MLKQLESDGNVVKTLTLRVVQTLLSILFLFSVRKQMRGLVFLSSEEVLDVFSFGQFML